MNQVEKEALIECSLHLSAALAQIERMEVVIAKALAASQRCEPLPIRWEREAHTALRLLREDRKELFDV